MAMQISSATPIVCMPGLERNDLRSNLRRSEVAGFLRPSEGTRAPLSITGEERGVILSPAGAKQLPNPPSSARPLIPCIVRLRILGHRSRIAFREALVQPRLSIKPGLVISLG